MSTPAFHAAWAQGCRALATCEPGLACLIERYDGEALAPHGDVFFTLARAITGQQISVLAAERIWSRVRTSVGAVTPAHVAAARTEDLLACGLTRSKAAYLKSLAESFSASRALPCWHDLGEGDLLAALTTLRGVGPWTAQMAMIFALGRLDVLPLADIGLQRAASGRFGIDRSAEALAIRAESWRPWRTIAVWHLWRDLDPVPVVY